MSNLLRLTLQHTVPIILQQQWQSKRTADQAEQQSMLTNQFTDAWTHYTCTLQGTQTDHMVGCFQTILIE